MFDAILQGVNNITDLFDKRFIKTIYLPCLVFCSILLAMIVYTQGPGPIIEQWNAQTLDVRALILLFFLSVVYLFAYILSAFLMRIIKYYEGYGGILSFLIDFRKKYYQDEYTFICNRINRMQDLKIQRKSEEKKLTPLEEELKRIEAGTDANTENRKQELKLSIKGINSSLETIDNEIKVSSKKMAEYYHEIYYHYPPCGKNIEDILPTRLGNTISSAELYPLYRYNIDAALVWPRLYPLLPEPFVGMIASKKSSLDSYIVISFLGLLFVLLGGVYLFFIKPTWWLFPIAFFGGIVIWWIMYKCAIQAAIGYGNLIRVAFDLYRGDLLKELGLGKPTTLDLDKEWPLWHKIGQFIFFGTKQNFDPPLPPIDGDD